MGVKVFHWSILQKMWVIETFKFCNTWRKFANIHIKMHKPSFLFELHTKIGVSQVAEIFSKAMCQALPVEFFFKFWKKPKLVQPLLLPGHQWVPTTNYSPFCPAVSPAITNILIYMSEEVYYIDFQRSLHL